MEESKKSLSVNGEEEKKRGGAVVDFADPKIKAIMKVLWEALNKDYLISSPLIKETFNLEEEVANEIFNQLLLEAFSKPRRVEEEIKKREVALPFKIYISGNRPERVSALKEVFKDEKGVEVFEGSLAHALEISRDVNYVVCPACKMEGNEELLSYFGQEAFQNEPSVAYDSVFVRDIPGVKCRLIQTYIKHPPLGAYSITECMNLSLKMAYDLKAKSVLFHDFCQATWRVDPKGLAKAMRRGYDRDFALLEHK